MKRPLRVAEQVLAFLRHLPPEPRKVVKQALRDLQEEKGDILLLEGSLTGYARLRVGRYRLIFAYAKDGALEVVFMEARNIVYEVFAQEFGQRLQGKGRAGLVGEEAL